MLTFPTNVVKTILEEMGFTRINAQGLTAPPYFLSFLLTIATTWAADRTQQRGIMVMIFSCIGGIGYVLLATVESVGVRYFGVWLAAGGIFPAIANIIPWVISKSRLLPLPFRSSLIHRKEIKVPRSRSSQQTIKARIRAAAWA